MGDNVCFYPFVLVYHWFSTVSCKAVVIPGCLLPWHDCHLAVQWNTNAAWAIIHSGFPVTPNQWKGERLDSEKRLEHPGYSSRRTCRTKRDHWCWAAFGLRFNLLCYFSKPFFFRKFRYTFLCLCTRWCLIFCCFAQSRYISLSYFSSISFKIQSHCRIGDIF